MSTPSAYPYPSPSPSSPPFSLTPTPGSLISSSPATLSPQVFISYTPIPSYSAPPISTGQFVQRTILSDVSNDAFYGIICAITIALFYSSTYAIYYYKKYKKEKNRVKRLNEINGKAHSTVRGVLNPVYPA